MQTETNVTKTKDVLVFTESAANKVKTLIEDEKNPKIEDEWEVVGNKEEDDYLLVKKNQNGMILECFLKLNYLF